MRRDFDVIVLGGGAAGLMCAIEAGKRGRRVAVLERAERIGKKILISGGGRCNFTNLHCRPENFISANPHFCKSALARYTPDDFIALVRKHGIAYHEKKLGQLFCDGSAREIVAMLEQECDSAGVQIFTNMKIAEVRRTDRFEIVVGDSSLVAPSLVVATGGLIDSQDRGNIIRIRPGAAVWVEGSAVQASTGSSAFQCGRPQALWRSRWRFRRSSRIERWSQQLPREDAVHASRS